MLKSNNKIQLEVNNSITLQDDIQTLEKGKGKKFVSRFIEPGVVSYSEFGDVLIKKETIDKFLKTIIGAPVIIKHKDITKDNVNKERVGVVSNAWYNKEDGWYYCDGILFDEQAIDLVKNQGWSVSCTYDFESDKKPLVHNGKELSMEFTGGEFLHLALVPNPRYNDANIVMNSKDLKAENGFITLDETDENGDRKVIWIPENVHYVKPSERSRVLKICDNYKQGDETIYNFEHTRVKPTEEQVQYLKDTVGEINDSYSYKGIAQIEISSSLNNGSWGVCFAPNNTSLISIAPSMYKENAQEKYDASVESGFHPKGTGEAIKSVLVHEIGHAITCNSKNDKFWGKIDSIRSEYLKTIKEDDTSNPDFISNYARVNRYEFVAEAFCQGHLSKKYGKYTKQVMELMKEHFSKGSKANVSNSQDKENNEMWIEEYGFGYPIDEEEYNKFRKDIGEERKEDAKKTSNNSLDSIITNALTEVIIENCLGE